MTSPQKTFLFVGGPADGELRVMELNAHNQPRYNWTVVVQDRQPVRLYEFVDDQNETMFKTYEYRLEYVNDFDGEIIGLYRGEDVKNVFELLMTNYKPAKKDGGR